MNEATLSAIAAGVSGRRYGATLDRLPEGERESAVSRSSVSRRFVALSAKRFSEWLSRSLAGLDLPVVLVDGIHFRERVLLVALGIDSEGHKHVLGLCEGSTENVTVLKALLADLIERGLDPEHPRLWVIDGAKALRRALREFFGQTVLVQRCQVHKLRNVLEHLPERLRPSVRRAMNDAWNSSSTELGLRQLDRLARSLAREHPGAAASLREGLEETLTVLRLGIEGALLRTLRSTPTPSRTSTGRWRTTAGTCAAGATQACFFVGWPRRSLRPAGAFGAFAAIAILRSCAPRLSARRAHTPSPPNARSRNMNPGAATARRSTRYGTLPPKA